MSDDALRSPARTQSSCDHFWIHCNPDKKKPVTENENADRAFEAYPSKDNVKSIMLPSIMTET